VDAVFLPTIRSRLRFRAERKHKAEREAPGFASKSMIAIRRDSKNGT
jgi:hypothetical protein